MIRNFASEIARKLVGKCWVNYFIKGHQIHLISHWTVGINSKRHNADSAFKYSLYFNPLRDKIKQYNIKPQNLTTTQEKELVKYIDSLYKRGLPPTREMIRNFVSEIAKKLVGKS